MESFSNEAKNEVRRLLANREKLTAIKYLRDTFNISLEEAKLLVEAVEQENPTQPHVVVYTTPTPPPNQVTDRLRSDITQLIQAGKKIEAVKLVKNELKLSLKESLIIVDNIHREFDPNYKPMQLETGCLGKVFKVIAYVFLVVAIFCLGITAIVYFMQEDTISNGDKVTGIVTGFSQSDTGGAAPIVEYTWRGEKRVYTSTLFSTPPSFALNESVELYINKDKPEEVLIDSFSERWLVITVFLSIGAFFGIFFLIFLFVSRKF